ncbi:hypothetical protein CC86DRAFT_203925 [Ophiobolus disseminans]|uniref:Uncharacterized protein n=1 Tax=Ophiobolus disseminans TaxID=1469910 RepID=A0A6A7A456_9PLEO|nr:hypothetical protein CC86DRAFT_203925 [Ophiobolus disseminans]
MEKIKSVLSGHKKSEDATQDVQTTSTGTTHDSQHTPIYDSMKGTSSTQPTIAGTSTSTGQTAPSYGLGHTQHTGTDGPIGSHSTIGGENARPDVNPTGAGHVHQGMSEASIKSGVIGFGGTGQRQEHAALSSHNPESNLDSNQIVGGGNTGRGPTTADTAEQPSALKQALPLTGNSASDQPHSTTSTTGALGSTAETSTSRQPFDQSLRQESYTNDTDRSFPLAGGVASKHYPSSTHTDHHTSTHQPHQQFSSTHQPTTSAREPGTKEKEAGVRDGHGREGLAGAAAAATMIGAAAPLSQSHQRDVQPQGQDTLQPTYGNQPSALSSTGPVSSATSHTPQSHHPDALAAATAAASTSSTLSPSTQGQGIGAQDRSLGNASTVSNTGIPSTHHQGTGERPTGHKSDSYRHVPGGFPSPTPDESKTFLYYRDQVVPEPGLDGPVYHAHKGIHPEHQDGKIHPAQPIAAGTAGALAGNHNTHDGHGTQSHTSGTIGSGNSTAGPHQSNLLNKADPRVDSDLDGSRNTQGHTTNVPTGTSTSTGVPSSQHELRHTGSLEQPRPRSSEFSEEHHHGRDAAVAGGLGAGAAGLGYAATRDRDTPNTGSSNLPQESSPYSSKQLDPRALGTQANLEGQRYDPQVSSTTHHPSSNLASASSTTQSHRDDTVGTDKSTTGPHKSSLLNKLDPRVKNDTSKNTDTTTTRQAEPESHHGRDAALVGGGVAAGVGARQALQRNDTPGAGTAILPADQTARSTGPLSSSATTAPQHSANTSAPLSGSTTTAPQQSSHTSAPLTGSTASASNPANPDSSTLDRHGETYDTYHGPKTTSGSPFYGAVGAPAPIEDTQSRQPASASSITSPTTQQHDKDHHHGRDAGLAGAGLATAGGLGYASQRGDTTNTGPASSTLGPHSSHAANTVDPRVQSDQKTHTTAGSHQSDTLNRIDPNTHEKDHHHGRDAAVVGGTGAAGYSAYEAAKTSGSHGSTQPYDDRTTGRNPATSVPTTGQHDHTDHTGRNVALGSGAALGAGALGGAAYGGTRHADNSQVPASSNQPLSSSAHPTQGTFGQQAHDPSVAAYPTQGLIPAQYDQNTAPGTTRGPHDLTQDSRDKDHTKRDAALLSTGAAVVGGAAYAHSQNQDADRERARIEKEQQERLKKEQHDREKEQHRLDKEQSKQEKDAHKLEKEQAKHDKEVHKHDKATAAHEKADRKHEKDQEKEAARLEKEREKEAKRLEEENKPEKKHGIFGFLHRDKSKKEKSSADNSPRQSGEVRRSVDTKRHSKEYAAGGAALGAGTTAAAYDDDNPDSPRWKGKNKLHKDPPAGHPARESLDHHEMGEIQGGKREHVGVDGPIGNPDAISGYQQTGRNTYGAQPISEIPAQTRVIEPHTGLPMNIGRYGDGRGGTDGNTNIHGHHGHETAGQGLTSGPGGYGNTTGQGLSTGPGTHETTTITGQGLTGSNATGTGHGLATGPTGHGNTTGHGTSTGHGL